MKRIDINEVQKRRYETFEKEKDNLILTKIDGGYSISNLNKGSIYTVTKDSSGKVQCNCKDYVKHDGLIRCKHCITVSKKADRISKAAIKAEDNEININKEENNVNNQIINNPYDNNPVIPDQEDIKTLQDILNRPFTQELIKYRKGFNGARLAYIETHSVIERLNEAFGLFWNWEVTDFAIEEKQVYCKGKLTVTVTGRTIVKEGFGGKQRSMEIGDDLKSASSDALKKASSLLGVGLYLYKGTQGMNSNTAPTVSTAAKPSISTAKQTADPTTAPAAPATYTNRPTTTTPTKPSVEVPAQANGSVPKKPGGNGKGGNGKGDTDINQIIKRW